MSVSVQYFDITTTAAGLLLLLTETSLRPLIQPGYFDRVWHICFNLYRVVYDPRRFGDIAILVASDEPLAL
ncbi:hypothetical protein O9929_02010 [Vibrio lentus]|nr:hypothetical protein [Vibrio lentus]